MKLEKLQDLLEQFIDDYSHRIEDEVSEAATVVINSIAELLDEEDSDDDNDGEDLTEIFRDD